MTVSSLPHRHHAEVLHDFVACAAELLASDDEARRCRLENRLLALLPTVRDTPAFAVFDIRDPALRAMLADRDKDPPQSANNVPTCRAANGDNIAWLAY